MADSSTDKRVVVGLSGASGTVYGTRLIEVLVRMDFEVHLFVSPSTWKVMAAELGIEGVSPSTPMKEWLALSQEEIDARVRVYNVRDIAAAPASGTFKSHGMVVIPASMKTVAAMAHGYADNLLTRCADCFLKEGRRLIVVPRETPLSLIHLRNLTLLAEAGARIVPAMPGFYHQPKSLGDIVDFMVMKVLDQLGIEHQFQDFVWTGPRGRA